MLERFGGRSAVAAGSVFKIPPFSGEINSFPVERFIFAVEHRTKKDKWTNAESAQNAAQAMTGQCRRWFADLANESPKVKRDWQLLKAKLELKFGGSLSLTERFEVLQGLQLGAGESTEDFYDRVSADLHTIEQEVLVGAVDQKLLIPMHQLFTTLVFISGLEPELRSFVLSSEAARQKTRLATAEEIRTSAKSVQDLMKVWPNREASRGGAQKMVESQKTVDKIEQEKKKVETSEASTQVEARKLQRSKASQTNWSMARRSQPRGPNTGPSGGHHGFQGTGQNTDPVIGTSVFVNPTGPISGQNPGPISGQNPGPNTGQNTGQDTGHNSSSNNGQNMGSSIGQTQGPNGNSQRGGQGRGRNNGRSRGRGRPGNQPRPSSNPNGSGSEAWPASDLLRNPDRPPGGYPGNRGYEVGARVVPQAGVYWAGDNYGADLRNFPSPPPSYKE